MASTNDELHWYFSQVKGTIDDDVSERKLYNYSLALLCHERF